jgi:hypothetical protein
MAEQNVGDDESVHPLSEPDVSLPPTLQEQPRYTRRLSLAPAIARPILAALRFTP